MRLLTLSLALVGLPLVVSCGDDNQNADGGIDAARDAPPDAREFKGFEADEAGEVKFEYVNFMNGENRIRTTAFFYKNPGTPSFYPLLSFNGCTDSNPAGAGSELWPGGQSDDRTYYEWSDVIVAGGPAPFNVQSRAVMVPASPDPYFDNIGRTHPKGQSHFFFPTPVTDPSPGVWAATKYITAATGYDVFVAGSADLPAQVFDDALWVPNTYVLTSPIPTGCTHPLGDCPVVLTPGQDITFTWTQAAQPNKPQDRDVMALVGFAGASGISVLCVEPDDGSITVPGAMVDKVFAKYPTGGVIVRQTFTHVVRELVDRNGPTGRRVDFIGVWCNNANWTPAP